MAMDKDFCKIQRIQALKNYTLWPFWVDTHVDPPFRKDNKTGKIYDSANRLVSYYPDVPQILEKLNSQGVLLGIASRTSAVEEAHDLVDLFGWSKYFAQKEIYPGDKSSHFKRFREATGIEYKKMLFFDDETRNINSVSRLGVTSILVPNGMTLNLLDQALKTFSENSQK